jgi:hypothetical protein
LAGGIVPGVARSIVTLSAHAEVFGVGITVMVGSILVPASCATVDWIVPGAELPGIWGVESSKAAPLVGGPPGVELHTVVDEPPSGTTGDAVPVVLPAIAVGMLPKGLAGIIPTDDVGVAILLAVAAMTGFSGVDDDVPDVAPPIVGPGVTDTAGVPGAICPVGAEQVMTVPGVVGSEASGTGASVVSGELGWVVAENGLGPFSGDVTIVPGVDGRPMAVVPMVETWARLALQPDSSTTIANSRCRIAIASFEPI